MEYTYKLPGVFVKKTIVIILLFLVVIFAANSFEFSLGIKAGPAIGLGSGTIPDDYSSPKVGFAWSAGIAADLILTDLFAIEVNALYAALYDFGYNADPAINGVNISQQTLSLSAIEVPVLAKFRLGKGSGKWTLGAGPDFFFLLGDKPKTFINELATGAGLAYEHNVLYGLAAAVGYEFPAGKKGSVSFELRYTKPLTYFYTKDYNPQGGNAGYQRFDLLVGYYFF